MNRALLGSVYSFENIDASPVPRVPKHLMPWIHKDRREAMEGTGIVYIDSKTGEASPDVNHLAHAEKEIRKAKNALAAKDNSPDRAAILRLQLAQAETKAEFYRGKIRILDRIIASGGV